MTATGKGSLLGHPTARERRKVAPASKRSKERTLALPLYFIIPALEIHESPARPVQYVHEELCKREEVGSAGALLLSSWKLPPHPHKCE